jgi:hypothetical protein
MMPKPSAAKPMGMSNEYEHVLSMGDELGQYVHKWIAVVNSTVVAKGDDANQVYAEAKRAHPNKIPLIMKVPADEVMLL